MRSLASMMELRILSYLSIGTLNDSGIILIFCVLRALALSSYMISLFSRPAIYSRKLPICGPAKFIGISFGVAGVVFSATGGVPPEAPEPPEAGAPSVLGGVSWANPARHSVADRAMMQMNTVNLLDIQTS